MYTIDDEFRHVRDLALTNTLLYTRIRRNELLGLRLRDIDFGSKTIYINYHTSKSKKSRYIPIHPILESQLRTYIAMLKTMEITTDALFISKRDHTPLTVHGLKHWTKKYSAKSGVHIHPHRFRHTFACALERGKTHIIAIRNLMGHENVNMTQTYLRSIQNESSRSDIYNMSF